MKNPKDEKYIIELIREGKTNREVAEALNTTELTIKDKVHKLLRKHNCKNRIDPTSNVARKRSAWNYLKIAL